MGMKSASNMSDHLPSFVLPEDLGNKSSPSRIQHWNFQASPDWLEVSDTLKWSWPVHYYGFASGFLLLSSYTFISILTLRSNLPWRPFVSTINIFVLLLGLSRSICLFTDPYDSVKRMPNFIGTMLWRLGYPCLLSAFGLTQLAFNSSTKLQIGLEWFRSQLHISTAAAAHFSMMFICSILPAFQADSMILYYITQSLFVFWGLILCSTFMYNGWRFLRRRKKGIGKNYGGQLKVDDKHELDDMSTKPFLNKVPKNAQSKGNNMAPKIRITDEFEQTISYVSDSPSTSIQGSTSFITANRPKKSSIVQRKECERKIETILNAGSFNTGYHTRRYSFEDQVLHSSKRKNVYLDDTSSSPKRRLSHSDVSAKKISKIEEQADLLRNGKMYSRNPSSGQISTCPSDIVILKKVEMATTDTRSQKNVHVDRLLRKIVVSAAIGIVLNIFQSCLLYGPFGVTEGHKPQSVIPWFIFMSLFRLVEMLMGYTIASVARQPLPRKRMFQTNKASYSSSLLFGAFETDDH